jgi:histidyl-tRNA synthetase
MAKITPISGFPEWLPEQRIAEEEVTSKIMAIYKAHGFTGIETRAIEPMSVLTSKGDINKEVYKIERALAEDSERDKKEDALALHFDLTIPFARYVAQNFNELDFPFKRYQLQKVWRGERPQEGRFREFYQFDIDTVSIDELPICHDAEMISIIDEVFSSLNLARHQIKINNRKLLLGLYEFLGLNEDQRNAAVTEVDKIHKIGADGVTKSLLNLGIEQKAASEIVRCASIQVAPANLTEITGMPASSNESFKAGAKEIEDVIALLSIETQKNVIIDLSLARGLDYYTGTIIETVLLDYPSYGSVAGGGRYENLTARFSNKKIPGVGISVGLTRLMSLFLSKGLITTSKKSPTEVLITLSAPEKMPTAFSVSREFRKLGINTEVFHKAAKFGKQIEYADKKGIPWVVFINDDGSLEAKDLRTKEQLKVTAKDLALRIKAV